MAPARLPPPRGYPGPWAGIVRTPLPRLLKRRLAKPTANSLLAAIAEMIPTITENDPVPIADVPVPPHGPGLFVFAISRMGSTFTFNIHPCLSPFNSIFFGNLDCQAHRSPFFFLSPLGSPMNCNTVKFSCSK